jgi:hypothetical protein
MGGRAKGDKGMKRIKERKISGQEWLYDRVWQSIVYRTEGVKGMGR